MLRRTWQLAFGLTAWMVALALSSGGCGDDGGSTCDPAQCPGQDTACSFRVCENGACAIETPTRTACAENGGTLCDGDGKCVQCIVDDDCGGNVGCNFAGNCLPPSCVDGLLNGNESDVDCGAACSPCLNGQTCGVAEDCDSGVCSSGTCTPCQNNGECGAGLNCDPMTGNCISAGTLGQPCNDAGSCDSGFCSDGVCCDAACDGSCQSCGLAGMLGSCSPYQAGTDPETECTAPDSCNGSAQCGCADGALNGDETDVDCGGAACMACSNDQACVAPADCVSGTCLNNLCTSPSCVDMILNGDETDLDCGGSLCGPCADGQACVAPADCVSGVCSGNICQLPSCSDNVSNGTETDVDCGGGVCPSCANTLMCNQPSDCQSGICAGNVCSAPSCTDMLLNGQETDVDCGGPICKDCNAGQICSQGTDCYSGICNGNVCACSPALNPIDDGSGANGLPDLVMSEISPGNYIELYNTTGAPINLAAGNHWLCSPFDYAKVGTLAPTTIIPAGSYATIPWPVGFTDVVAGGEVILYASAGFTDGTQILDFSCWGVNPHGTRKPLAETAGKWSGACNAALGNASIHRNLSSTGVTTASYNTVATQSPMNCTP